MSDEDLTAAVMRECNAWHTGTPVKLTDNMREYIRRMAASA